MRREGDRRARSAERYLGSGLNPTRSEVRGYWPSGALKSVTVTGTGTAAPAVTTHCYDSLVRLKTTCDSSAGPGACDAFSDTAICAASGKWNYGYDLNDNRTLEDDPATGRSLQMAYNDPLDRVTSRPELGSPDGRSTTFEYDGPVAFGTGRLYRATRSQTAGTFMSQTTYGEYDARGNVKQAT